MLYHIDKTNLINNNTLYKHKSWTWLNNNENKIDFLILVG